MSMIRSRAIRYLAKVCAVFFLMLGVLFAVGYWLASSLNTSQGAIISIDNNRLLFVVCRFMVYSLMLALLTPSVWAWVRQWVSLTIQTGRLTYSRKVVLISLVAYEVMLVQGGYYALIQWGYRYVSG